MEAFKYARQRLFDSFIINNDRMMKEIYNLLFNMLLYNISSIFFQSQLTFKASKKIIEIKMASKGLSGDEIESIKSDFSFKTCKNPQ